MRTTLLSLTIFISLSHGQHVQTSPLFISPVVASSRPSSEPTTSPTSALSSSVTAYSTDSSMGTPFASMPALSLADTSTDEQNPDHDNRSLLNYYFLFLAAFGVLVALLLWWMHRRKMQRRAQLQRGGQNALARDLEGWAGTRRYMHGGYGRYQAARVRRQEGLDEHGDAPPPYQPKSDVDMEHHEPPASLTVPMRTLSREEIERTRPPGYAATVGGHGLSSARQDSSAP